MMNYLAIDETHIQIEFGILGDVSSFQTYPSGELQGVKLVGKNMIMTHAGELVPYYTQTERRKNKPSVEFHKNGIIKAVMLEEQSEVETPIGTLPAEYVTFYSTGEINRVFVSDGQISGFWTEEEERDYNIPLSFEFEFTKFTARLNGICFYKSGNVKSITLYPGERVSLKTSTGEFDTAIGFSMYEDGNLKSAEPAEAVLINTPIGQFSAFDPDATGINADSNSLQFDTYGRIISFSTVSNRVSVQTAESEFFVFQPEQKQHPMYDDMKITCPMKIGFDFDTDIVTISSDQSSHTFQVSTCGFTVQGIRTDLFGCTPEDCASCSMCQSKNNAV